MAQIRAAPPTPERTGAAFHLTFGSKRTISICSIPFAICFVATQQPQQSRQALASDPAKRGLRQSRPSSHEPSSQEERGGSALRGHLLSVPIPFSEYWLYQPLKLELNWRELFQLSNWSLKQSTVCLGSTNVFFFYFHFMLTLACY